MFYEKQSENNKNNYKLMLKTVGRLSRLFSESKCPYLAYRAHENIFCKYLKAENLARADCSADAKKERTGIGLKTWMGNDDQKVAEFGKLKKYYANLQGIELVKQIAQYRNERIRVTKKMNGIDEMVYHVVRRIPGVMQILECVFEPIDIDKIEVIKNRGNYNNTYFTDGKHTYHFSISKNTLYMIFDDLELLDEINVEIVDDPYRLLMDLTNGSKTKEQGIWAGDYDIDFGKTIKEQKEQLCLPLYTVNKNGEKYVALKSGLNQWNASGRKRNPDEIYIPYQKKDRDRKIDLFPPRDTPFVLHLPDGTDISAKVCQVADKNNPAVGKSIMSNPNKVLGKWLLREVFELAEGTVVTYEMLEKFGIDSVIFTKNDELDYSIEFSELGTYEDFYEE